MRKWANDGANWADWVQNCRWVGLPMSSTTSKRTTYIKLLLFSAVDCMTTFISAVNLLVACDSSGACFGQHQKLVEIKVKRVHCMWTNWADRARCCRVAHSIFNHTEQNSGHSQSSKPEDDCLSGRRRAKRAMFVVQEWVVDTIY